MKKHIDKAGNLCIIADTDLEQQYLKWLLGSEGSAKLSEVWKSEGEAMGFTISRGEGLPIKEGLPTKMSRGQRP